MAGDQASTVRRRWRAVVAATLSAGSLGLPAPVDAAGPVPAVLAAAIPSAPCQRGGVTAVDNVIASGLRSSMTGKRLGRSVSGQSISCARAIVSNVRARGLGGRAAVIAVTTAIAESTLHNYTVAVDHDSLGLFQQRPSMRWGRPDQLVDPGYATQAFLTAMIRKYPDNGWLAGDIGQICQRVQNSAFPGAYAPEAQDAQLIVAAVWPHTGTRDGAPAAPAPKKPSGPFQQVLSADGTGLVTTDERFDVSTADWNGDRRPDLVVVQRSGAASGKTELRIMDGASKFQPLLLHTGTVLDPTDDRHAFAMTDWNGDAKLDLVVVQRSGTASGRTELRILDGASSFQRFLLETPTVLGPTDDRHEFSMADWNGDARPDLVVVQKSGTASGQTEVQVIDGAANFQRQLAQNATAQGPTDERHQVALADWNRDRRLDLVVVQAPGTVRIFDGASGFRRTLLKAGFPQGPTDNHHDVSVTDWNADGKLDLVVVQKAGTASGRMEARVLGG